MLHLTQIAMIGPFIYLDNWVILQLMHGNTIAILTGIIVLGIACQWLSWRAKLPSILFLLLSGILIGPVLGLLEPQTLLGDLLFPFVSLAVAIVLFEGSLTLRFRRQGRTCRALRSR